MNSSRNQGTSQATTTPLYMVPALAFFSRHIYLEAAFLWRRRAFIYLLLLVSVCWLPATAVWYLEGSRFMAEQADDYIRQLPTLTLQDGAVSVNAPEPIFILDQQSGTDALIIDTTGEITSLNDSTARILITRNRVMARAADGQTQVYDLSTLQDVVLTPEEAHYWLAFTLRWGPFIFFPFLALMSFGYRIFQILLISAIGLAVKPVTGCPLPFASLTRVAVVAITPSVLLATVMVVFRIEPPLGWLPFFAISMAYMLFGMSAATPNLKES